LAQLDGKDAKSGADFAGECRQRVEAGLIAPAALARIGAATIGTLTRTIHD
jgi:hypothetical protein